MKNPFIFYLSKANTSKNFRTNTINYFIREFGSPKYRKLCFAFCSILWPKNCVDVLSDENMNVVEMFINAAQLWKRVSGVWGRFEENLCKAGNFPPPVGVRFSHVPYRNGCRSSIGLMV